MPVTTSPVESRVHGVVLWFDTAKGFGFITSDEQPARRVFVEFSGIDLPGYRTLTEHQPVSFTLERDERGLHAAAVRPR
ncbi:cold shock domain-containing protein [Nocardia sp. CDC153]|uniref:cold-shock protein n=1 Tax=Nocardia sp. CDC153 TaxID=3112167 RepID=UPI002DB7BA7F|nr:cold shock domain-containing protein [Nocardia sp. CDC153]MEC3954197.1 cold shock domain-containing protein [Nocardia sp. CDC153]